MKTRRAYTMGARAAAAEDTRRRILQSTVDLANDRKIAAISLEDVAGGADVSVQTVLRRFGSRADLIDAAFAFAQDQVVEERRAPIGDVAAAVRVVVDHYERRGDTSLLMLAQEDSDALARRMTDQGKRLHRAWVTEVFGPLVADDEAPLDLLAVATDVYTWKLLRRDRELSRARTEARMKSLVTSILATTDPEGS